jgi:hypothetical protein
VAQGQIWTEIRKNQWTWRQVETCNQKNTKNERNVGNS